MAERAHHAPNSSTLDFENEIVALRVLTLTIVRSAVIDGGLEISISCDIRIAAHEAQNVFDGH
jgi:enoyl-CoA hydratase/carnithine racemase